MMQNTRHFVKKYALYAGNGAGIAEKAHTGQRYDMEDMAMARYL